jgi:putative hydrolase of the HAD superfamily
MLMTLYSSTKPILLKQSKNCAMEDYLSHQSISKELFKMEIDNLKLYGYGINILSMIEAAMRISNNTLPLKSRKYYNTAKSYLKTDCFIGVEETLEALQYKQASSCHQR